MRVHTLSFVLLSSILACGEDDAASGGPPAKTVQDTAGRTCTVTSTDVSCDKAPEPVPACTGAAKACYLVSSVGGSVLGPAAVCPACCEGNTARGSGKDTCAKVSCTSDSDCPDLYGLCKSGECFQRQ